MAKRYQIVERETRVASEDLAKFLAKEGQLLLPMVELIEQAECAVDELVDVMGRATVEAILQMSAQQLVGEKQQGKASEEREVYWYGKQKGRVALRDRKLRVDKPRLRKKNPAPGEPGEVPVPAYEAMRGDRRLADRMLEILMQGVSTRKYEKVLPKMAEQVGISKSEVSRETIEAGTRLLKELAERDFSDQEILVMYVDGIQFGEHHVIAAIGVDDQGRKHVLALRDGASENAQVATALLEDLVARGVKPDRRRLFVIDGSKALRKAVDQVYGAKNPVQRCRNHKLRNVVGHLPKEQQNQARATLRAAWKLDPDKGKAKIDQYASWLERDWPSAAGSLREGLDELFTVNRLSLPDALLRCLATTNLIDSSHSGLRQRTGRVTNWQSGEMALRWAAVAFIETEKNFRRILGCKQMWMLKAHLDASSSSEEVVNKKQVG